MSKLSTLVLTLFAVIALSACSSDTLMPQPNGLNPQETTLADWAAAQGYTVEILAAGLGNKSTTPEPCDCAEETLTVSDPDSVEMIYAQVVIKGTAQTEFPDDVIVSTASETKSFTGGGLAQSFVNPQGLPAVDDTPIYEGVFGAAPSITAEVQGVSTDGYYQPRAFIIYVFRKNDTSVSVGKTPNYYLWWSPGYTTATETLMIPASDEDRTVEVTFAISELESDERDVVLDASAGGMSVTSGSISMPDEDEVLVKTLSLTVPAGVTEITTTVTSPQGSGDSFYWSGINVTLPVEEEPEPGVGRFTGGGHVISDGVRYNFGLTLHCDVELSNNLEINWGNGKDSSRWHIEKESLTDVLCTDDPDITQEPPRAPLDTMTADAVGRLTFGEYKNADGSPIRFTIVDAGEPGKKDSIEVMIWAPGADPDSDEPLVSFAGNLKGGNLQAHYDQPHGNKP